MLHPLCSMMVPRNWTIVACGFEPPEGGMECSGEIDPVEAHHDVGIGNRFPRLGDRVDAGLARVQGMIGRNPAPDLQIGQHACAEGLGEAARARPTRSGCAIRGRRGARAAWRAQARRRRRAIGLAMPRPSTRGMKRAGSSGPAVSRSGASWSPRRDRCRPGLAAASRRATRHAGSLRGRLTATRG
jgi:hypothetical protein